MNYNPIAMTETQQTVFNQVSDLMGEAKTKLREAISECKYGTQEREKSKVETYARLRDLIAQDDLKTIADMKIAFKTFQMAMFWADRMLQTDARHQAQGGVEEAISKALWLLEVE